MRLVPTPFLGMNQLITGLPLNIFIAFMAPAAEGKSILLTQLAIHGANELGGNVLFVNTEETSSLTVDVWQPKFTAKYGFAGEVFSEYCPSAEDLLAFVGVKAKITRGAKNDITPEAIDYGNSSLVNYLENKNIKVVVFDSLTAAFDPLMVGGRQNLPCRNNAQNLFFEAIKSIVKGREILLLSANHVTFDPMDAYRAKEDTEIKGGKAIFHNHKLIFYLEQQKSRYVLEVRRVYIVRHPAFKEWTKSFAIVIDDDGWRDISTDEIKNLYTDNKKAIEERQKENSVSAQSVKKVEAQKSFPVSTKS